MNKPKVLTAIFVSNKGLPDEKWYKYRNISNNEKSLFSFINFSKKRSANEINLYCKKTGQFWQKIVLTDR